MLKSLTINVLTALLALFWAEQAMTFPILGMFTARDGEGCEVDVIPYAPIQVHFLVMTTSIDFLQYIEFSVPTFPRNDGYPIGILTESWNGIVTGDLREGLSLAFEPYLAADSYGVFHLGTIELLAFSEDWIGQDVYCHFQNVMIMDVHGETHVSWWSSNFIFNCFYSDCWFDEECNSPYSNSTSFEAYHYFPWTGSMIQGEFQLEFDVRSTIFQFGDFPFTGEIYMNGILAHEFSGEKSCHLSFPLSTEGLEIGSEFTVRVDANMVNLGYEDHDILTFTVGDPTPTRPLNWGALKSIY